MAASLRLDLGPFARVRSTYHRPGSSSTTARASQWRGRGRVVAQRDHPQAAPVVEREPHLGALGTARQGPPARGWARAAPSFPRRATPRARAGPRREYRRSSSRRRLPGPSAARSTPRPRAPPSATRSEALPARTVGNEAVAVARVRDQAQERVGLCRPGLRDAHHLVSASHTTVEVAKHVPHDDHVGEPLVRRRARPPAPSRAPRGAPRAAPRGTRRSPRRG